MNNSNNPMQDVLARFFETGLMAVDLGKTTIHKTLTALTGTKASSRQEGPPVNGPAALDTALSDFANRLVRIGWFANRRDPYLLKLTGEIMEAARRSFQSVDLWKPNGLALPFTLPLSVSSLLAESLLRILAVYSTVGVRQSPILLDNAMETFSEAGVYLKLEYTELIDRYSERLQKDPNDFDARLELGRTYIKCGLCDQAVHELEIAAQNPPTQAAALHHLGLAHYRAGRFRQAVESCVKSLFIDPNRERTRVWLWYSAEAMGGYPEDVPAEYRLEMKPGWEPATTQYEDIAAKIGLDKTSGGRGTAVFDYNNDGLLDVMIASAYGGCCLYRNNGDGTFTDVSTRSGLDQCVNAFNVSAADYDNDGFVDVFVTRQGFYSGDSVLYHNNGDGTFTNVTEKAGVQSWGPAFSASWVDYDCDGYLDLYICYNIGGVFDHRVPNKLFHNNGDGTFTDVTQPAGLYNLYPSICAAWGDYNNDGYPDLFISSGLGRPQLFWNRGDGTFVDASLRAGFTQFKMGSVCFSCDYNNDGWLDIVQYAWCDHEDEIFSIKNGTAREGAPVACIYHNNRDGTFTMLDRDIGIDTSWGTMSGTFGDLNNDGNLDLILGNGSPRMERLVPMIVLENDGGRYHNRTFTSGLPLIGKSHGVNCADLFGDGRLEIIVAAGGAYPGDLMTSSVYRPTKLPGNYLNVRLAGTKSNRDAIGARISLLAGGTRQMREIYGGSNVGCLPCEQHFGLGSLIKADAIEIRWPSGLVQRVENPPINDTIRVVEGVPGWIPIYHQ